MHLPHHLLLALLTFTLTITLLPHPTTAGSFALIEKAHTMSTGCDLRLTNVCGCTKDLSVHRIWGCESLPNVWTHGRVCGGKFQLNTQDGRHTVRFEKPGCKEGCNLNSLHGVLEGAPEASKDRKPGAHCSGLRY